MPVMSKFLKNMFILCVYVFYVFHVLGGLPDKPNEFEAQVKIVR